MCPLNRGNSKPIILQDGTNIPYANQNDAEIKILESAYHDLGSTSGTLEIFTDRQTCIYCQEVLFRAGFRRERPVANEIGQAKFTSFDVKGKPFYEADSLLNNNWIQDVIKGIKEQPKYCSNI